MHRQRNNKLKSQIEFAYSRGFYLALVVNDILIAIYL